VDTVTTASTGKRPVSPAMGRSGEVRITPQVQATCGSSAPTGRSPKVVMKDLDGDSDGISICPEKMRHFPTAGEVGAGRYEYRRSVAIRAPTPAGRNTSFHVILRYHSPDD